MVRKSVMVLGTNADEVKARANELLAGKEHIVHHSDILEYQRIVVAEPRAAINPDDIPEYVWPKNAPALFMIHATHD